MKVYNLYELSRYKHCWLIFSFSIVFIDLVEVELDCNIWTLRYTNDSKLILHLSSDTYLQDVWFGRASRMVEQVWDVQNASIGLRCPV